MLPAAAEGFVELDESEKFVGLGLREIEFGGEIVGFVGEDFEVAGHPTGITNVGKTRGIFGGSGEKFLLLAKFPELAITN